MFFVEAADLVRHFEQGVLRLEHEPTDRETLDRIFRGAHTLKGLSGMLRYDRIARFTHGLEDFLTRLRKGDLAVTAAVTDKLLAAADALGTLVREAGEASPTSAVDLDQSLGMLADVADTRRASPAARASDAATDGGTLRVATEKVDRLVDLVGELAVSQSMVAELVARIGPVHGPLQEAVTRMDRRVRELQERVMNVRVVPIQHAFARLPRLVRDLAHAAGRHVVLHTRGETTEVDKSVSEYIVDPLTHLVRNAVDHGIEAPDERERAGKDRVGRVEVSAYQQSGNIHIEVSDDGRGLDRDRIRAQAVAGGLIAATDVLGDRELFAFIFRPGFSTADRVSEISGRGVGMDIVARNIEALGGSIGIRTERGRGTTFHLTLPLTLVILEAQCLRVGGGVYIVPLLSIVECVRPRASDLHVLLHGVETFTLRGEVLPLIRLHRLFSLEPSSREATDGVVVIVERDGEKVALLVDELLAQQQVVIRSLETNYRKIEGLAGATILGDGSVALIVDVPGLLASSRARPDRRAMAPSTTTGGNP